ncbi:MAG: di-heme oxidoredictase family protein, partial [Ginsengibacter sp.]
PDTQKMELGRFGLKANTPTIKVQVASAYQQDMGVTNSLFPQESCYGQPQYDGRDDDPELPDSILNAVAFYVRTLAVPARRNVTDTIVKQGEKIFAQINCSGCHKPTIYTGVDVTLPVLSNQRIHPYTDLLLHDMGDGLADNKPDFLATGKEWRTPPLWGVGLLQRTNGTAFYLHDGRARTFEEAILWHGGEAEQSKHKFTQLSASARNALIQFLKSL